MNRDTYLIYYEGGPTASVPNRSTKSEQEVMEDLQDIPSHLEQYFGAETAIEPQDIEVHEVRGLSRRVIIVTTLDAAGVAMCLDKGLRGLDLYGAKIP